MSEPQVSVVIPTFNYGHLVCDAVDSVLAQAYRNIEVIVVDDGSTDDTRERLAKYGERIRYHYQPNAGLSAARNTGISLAKGDLIALLDSDDAFHPKKLLCQVEYLKARPEIGLVATNSFSDEPCVWHDHASADISVHTSTLELEDVVVKSRFVPSSVLIRRECFEKAGLFEAELRSVEDRDMWIRIAAQFRITLITLPLTWYRQTPGSMSRNASRMEQCEREVLEKAFRSPALSQRRFLRRRALSIAATSAAYMYLESGRYGVAMSRMLSAFAWWPGPLPPSDIGIPFARFKMIAAIARRAWQGS